MLSAVSADVLRTKIDSSSVVEESVPHNLLLGTALHLVTALSRRSSIAVHYLVSNAFLFRYNA